MDIVVRVAVPAARAVAAGAMSTPEGQFYESPNTDRRAGALLWVSDCRGPNRLTSHSMDRGRLT